MMYRGTYAKIYVNNIKDNVSKVINTYDNYKYYIGVVKADSYGHNSYKVIKAIIDGGCNYLAVSSLEEALAIRKKFDVPILCLGIINEKYIKVCQENNIDVTVTNIEYFEKIKGYNLNIQLKIDTGMNRLGIKTKEELDYIYKKIKGTNLKLQGIFTHIYEASDKKCTLLQLEKFKYITSSIDLANIPIVHIAQSQTLLNYPKIEFCNACRLGIIMYGLIENKINLKSTLSLISQVIEIKKIKKGETVGYDGKYMAKEDEIIAIISIGYADGINRKLTGAYVYINNKKYKIIGNICMDMLMLKIDSTVKLYDNVYIYKDINHIKYLSDYLGTISYELICDISKRVPRKYI